MGKVEEYGYSVKISDCCSGGQEMIERIAAINKGHNDAQTERNWWYQPESYALQ